MKRWTWAVLIAVAVVGLIALRVWVAFREERLALAADSPPPIPLASIPSLGNQGDYAPGSTVELWGEISSSKPYAHYYLGVFRSPNTIAGGGQPDVQRGIAARPGLFRISVPRGAGPVYLFLIPDTNPKELGPPDVALRVPYPGNPVIVRDHNIGNIRLEVP